VILSRNTGFELGMASGGMRPYSAVPVAVTRNRAWAHPALPATRVQAGNDPNDVLHEDFYKPTVNPVGFFLVHA
jgi:hypothetical protein